MTTSAEGSPTSSKTVPPARRPRKTALVFSGGGARGAYEAGVVRYLREELPARLGRTPQFDIVCGTSVGAINAAFVASTAEDPRAQARRMVEQWSALQFEEIFNISFGEVMRAGRLLLGGAPSAPRPGQLRLGGVLNTSGLERAVVRGIPWRRISQNIDSGKLDAMSVSATQVASGKTVVFVERRGGGLPPWSRDPSVRARAVLLGPLHVLASAAIPVLFPAVAVDGTYYSDGGLRQNTPLSPAMHLGADRILVVSLKHLATRTEEVAHAQENVESYPSPWFIFGKSLNALLLDPTDRDLDRLRHLNSVIRGGARAYGDNFLDEINRWLTQDQHPTLRHVEPLLIRPSMDIGRLAGEYARSGRLSRLPGIAGRVIRFLSSESPVQEADLLSYLMFDSDYLTELIELGHRDARAREDDLLAFFDDGPAALTTDDKKKG